MAQLSDFLRNLLYVFIIIQLIPFMFTTIRHTYSNLTEARTKVGIISVKGTLCNASPYIKNLRKFFKDDDIKAILLNIDCSGGTAGSAQAIYQEIIDLKKEHLKPIIVFIENICASGAYYIASAADQDGIVATPSALVGSIGVYIEQPQFKEFIEQFKVKYSVVKSGAYKTAGNPLLAPTAEGEAMLQSVTDDTYNQFIRDVAAARPQLSIDKANEWANGKIFTGRQAHGLLVDHIGSMSTVEQLLRKKAPIKGEIEWIAAHQQRSFMQWFTGDGEECGDLAESTAISLYNAFAHRFGGIHV
jgi:protease IV